MGRDAIQSAATCESIALRPSLAVIDMGRDEIISVFISVYKQDISCLLS